MKKVLVFLAFLLINIASKIIFEMFIPDSYKWVFAFITGEIAFAFYNLSAIPVTIQKGEKLGQGMFTVYKDVTNYTDENVEERKGGFGSTNG